MTDTFFTKSGSSPGDFAVENHGSVVLLKPISESGRIWVDEFIGPDNGFQPLYPTVVIETRYAFAVLEGIREHGLTVVRG